MALALREVRASTSLSLVSSGFLLVTDPWPRSLSCQLLSEIFTDLPVSYSINLMPILFHFSRTVHLWASVLIQTSLNQAPKIAQYLPPLLPNEFIFSKTPGTSVGKEYACNAEDPVSSPGSGRSPRVGNSNPLQNFCLENSMDKDDWLVTCHGITESWD